MISVSLFSGKLVSLRTMEPEDLETLYRLENDGRGWGQGTANVPYSREMLRQFIAKGTYNIYSDGWMRLMIESVEEGVSVGMVDLTSFSPRHLRAEVGIVVDGDYCRKGYASEALQLMERYGNEFLHLRQLYAYVSMENVASLGLFDKLGYERGGVLKDWLYEADGFVDVQIFQKILSSLKLE